MVFVATNCLFQLIQKSTYIYFRNRSKYFIKKVRRKSNNNYYYNNNLNVTIIYKIINNNSFVFLFKKYYQIILSLINNIDNISKQFIWKY